jgi:hypothetical protein
MRKVTLVCSAHREHGLCNAGELLKILGAIEPEAIFEEIRPADFDCYCKHGTNSSLEAQAIARYVDEFKPLRRVPVDRYDLPERPIAEIKGELDSVFDYVEQTSREYQLLIDENDRSVRQYGFGYLNSVDCATLRARLSEMEDKTINETGDQALIRRLESWRRLMQRREREMVGVIYEYCRENVFERGVFLVGAAHKMGIVKEIEEYARAEADLINWNFA